MRKNIMHEMSFSFAVNGIEAVKELVKKKEFIISKQFLRSCTSVGANIRESRNAQSKKDFIHKLSISLKECDCDESIYWLDLLKETNYITVGNYNLLFNEANQLQKMLSSSIITLKKKLN